MHKPNAQNYGAHALSPSVATRLPPGATRRHTASGTHCLCPRAQCCFREVVHAARLRPPLTPVAGPAPLAARACALAGRNAPGHARWRGGAAPLANCPRPRPAAFRCRRGNPRAATAEARESGAASWPPGSRQRPPGPRCPRLPARPRRPE